MSDNITKQEAAKLLKELWRLETLRPVLDAAVRGETIQVRGNDGTWWDSPYIGFIHSPDRYRVKPNPWQEFIDAQAAGKTVQYRPTPAEQWQDGPWEFPADGTGEYRIKHQWQDCVDAQAAGKEIQYRAQGVTEWRDFSSIPPRDRVCHEYLGVQYRIKPALVFAGWKPVREGFRRVVRWEAEWVGEAQ